MLTAASASAAAEQPSPASSSPASDRWQVEYARIAFKSRAITNGRPTIPFLATAHAFHMFRPQPAHHAHARSIGRPSQLARSPQRSTVCGVRGPLVASPFLQSGAVRPARPSRKNGAATSRPPAPVGSFAGSRSFPPPARCHVGCSGRPSRGWSCSAGNRRASAPPS